MSRELPKIGNWYKNVEEDQSFEVVAFDEDEELVQIQYESGELAELDLESWDQSAILPIDNPEDWDGPYEDTDLIDDDQVSRRRTAMNDDKEDWDEEDEEAEDMDVEEDDE